MTVRELKEECRKNGLKVSGTKSELIARLKNPSKEDIGNVKPKTVMVSLGWGDERSKSMSSLVEKKFARFVYYATDTFVYEVDKEKWAEVLSNKK
jgi:NAD/NADP transhydrogenase alpha subunit